MWKDTSEMGGKESKTRAESSDVRQVLMRVCLVLTFVKRRAVQDRWTEDMAFTRTLFQSGLTRGNRVKVAVVVETGMR